MAAKAPESPGTGGRSTQLVRAGGCLRMVALAVALARDYAEMHVISRNYVQNCVEA